MRSCRSRSLASIFFISLFSIASTGLSAPHYELGDIALPAAERIVAVATNSQLNDAINNARPGDRIVIADGSYNGLNLVGLKGTQGKPIVFVAENWRKAIISGSASGRNVRLSDCEYLEFHNMRFSGADVWGFTMGPAYSTDTTLGCNNIRLIGCEIDSAGQVLLKVNGNSSKIEIIGNSLHDSGMSGYGKPYAEGIYIGDGNNLNDRSHDVLVQGNHLYNIGNSNNWGEGIDIKVQVYNITVVDNLIEHVRVNSQGAITVLINDAAYPSSQTNPNILIARNVIRDVKRRSGGWNGAGISASSNGVTITNNLIWDTDEASITATRNASNTTGGFNVYNNTLWNGLLINQSSIGNADSPVVPDLKNNLIRSGGGTSADKVASVEDFIGPLDLKAIADVFTGSGFQLKADSSAVGSGAVLTQLDDDLLGQLRPASGYSYGAFEAVAGEPATTYSVAFDLSAGGYLEGPTPQTIISGGDSESVRAIPLSGYEFIGWTGGIESIENPLSLTNITSDLFIHAEFSAITDPTVDPQEPGLTLAAAINCAGGSYLASDGVIYQADHYFVSGQTVIRDASINGTEDDTLYQSERYGTFGYAVPLADGDYTLTLMFSETYWTTDGDRIFDVFVEEQRSIGDLDIHKEVGPNTAYSIVLPVYLRDGEINIELLATQDKAKLSAIRIERGIDPSLLANFEQVLLDELKYAINCGGLSYLASDGVLYSADRFYSGGVVGENTDAVAGTVDDPLYQSYRFKYTNYSFPVEDGDYRITFKLVESYWTSDQRRIFDITVENEVRIDDLDLHKAVGHDFAHDLTVTARVTDGQLDISNPASLDHGSIAAILIERINTDPFDSDGDGLADLVERALMLNPYDASDASANSPRASVAQSGDQQHLEIIFRRLVGGSGDAAEGYIADGIQYTVECNESLDGEWRTGSTLLQQVGATVDNGDGTETIRIQVKAPITDTSTMFIRLKVSRI